jgi:PAS domain S-box-containing protein
VRDLKYWPLSTDIQRMSEGVRGTAPDQIADASGPADQSLSPLHDAELRGQWEQTFVSTTRGITITNPVSGIIESTNPAFAAMHGGTVDDFVGQPAINPLSHEAQSQLGNVLALLNRDGHITMTSEHARLDGTTFPVAFEAITTRSLAGDVLYRIAWYEDLTEQRVAEAARREAHEMFEAAFADAPNGVALIGLDSRFLRVNSALCEMLGRPPEDLVGSEAITFFHPDDREAVQVTASVGVAPLDSHTTSDEEALEQADTAMYRDKAAHGLGSSARREHRRVSGSAQNGEHAAVRSELETLPASSETEASEHDRTIRGQERPTVPRGPERETLS